MKKILFVCHGNICRSPMAEFVMRDMVKNAGLEKVFEIESAATSTEELGNPVYPPARRKLAEHGIGCAGKTARRAGFAFCQCLAKFRRFCQLLANSGREHRAPCILHRAFRIIRESGGGAGHFCWR